ncbi:MAG: dTMP kinase [Lentisphaeria bacterium]|nr:dTMP kinase [Lentisphaeria bacterium]
MERKALFITFEGPEGAGKSTQIKLLKEYLESLGRKVLITREPGGTPLAENFRNIVKHYQGDEPLYPATELLLFEATRAQHIRYVISPALAAGTIVLCDRFADSTEAYQGAGRSLDMKFLQDLNNFAMAECKPDLTLLFDLPVEVGMERARARVAHIADHNDRLEAEKMDFHERVRNSFLQIAQREPERVKVLDATQSIEVLAAAVKELVNNALS